MPFLLPLSSNIVTYNVSVATVTKDKTTIRHLLTLILRYVSVATVTKDKTTIHDFLMLIIHCVSVATVTKDKTNNPSFAYANFTLCLRRHSNENLPRENLFLGLY